MSQTGTEHKRSQHLEEENESLHEDVTRFRVENERLRETVDKLEKQLRRKAPSATPFSSRKPRPIQGGQGGNGGQGIAAPNKHP